MIFNLNELLIEKLISQKMVDTSSLEGKKKVSLLLTDNIIDKIKKHRDEHEYKTLNETVGNILQEYFEDRKDA